MKIDMPRHDLAENPVSFQYGADNLKDLFVKDLKDQNLLKLKEIYIKADRLRQKSAEVYIAAVDVVASAIQSLKDGDALEGSILEDLLKTIESALNLLDQGKVMEAEKLMKQGHK